MGQGTRQSELLRRRNRKVRLQKLRTKLVAAKSTTDKDAVIAKLAKVAPWIAPDDFKAEAKKLAA